MTKTLTLKIDRIYEDMQAFEKYKALSNHIERMACTGDTGGINEWSKFLSDLNTCLMVLESRITELEDALGETFEQVYDNPHIDALVEKVLGDT